MISPLQRLALSTARPSLPAFRQTRTFAIRSSLHQNVTPPPPPPLSPPHAAAEPVTPVTPQTPVESPEMVRKRLPPRKPLVIRPTGPELTWLDYVQRGIVWTCVALTVSLAGPRPVDFADEWIGQVYGVVLIIHGFTVRAMKRKAVSRSSSVRGKIADAIVNLGGA